MTDPVTEPLTETTPADDIEAMVKLIRTKMADPLGLGRSLLVTELAETIVANGWISPDRYREAKSRWTERTVEAQRQRDVLRQRLSRHRL